MIVSILVNRFLFMAIHKGGRGIKAPYETTHIRIPVPLKAQIEALISDYRQSEQNEFVKEQMQPDEAVEYAREILKQKKSASVSVQKLLTAIYRQKIEL